MNEKRTDFLWIVQMIMFKHQDAMVGWSGVAGDAVAASYRIPSDLTARDARPSVLQRVCRGLCRREVGRGPRMANCSQQPRAIGL